MPDNLECVDRQWESRSVASILVAEAIDSLMAQGLGEHDAISALEDALQIRRVTFNIQIAQD
jgi:ribosomal protein S18 acetylase RimI-like enzyme